MSSSDLVPKKGLLTQYVSPDKPKVMIVSGSHKSVDVQFSSLTWLIHFHVSRQTDHGQAVTQRDSTTQQSDVCHGFHHSDEDNRDNVSDSDN